MNDELLERLRREIQRLKRLHVPRLRSAVDDSLEEAPAVWSLHEQVLCWDVVLRGALEPDIDVEIGRDVLVVWARAAHEPHRLLVGVLPVPDQYDPSRPMLRYEAEHLEVRIGRREDPR